MHAIDNLSDAIETTRNFLTPIRLGMWLRLAVVVFFVSSLGFGGPSFPGGDVGSFADDPAIEEEQPEGVEELEEDLPIEELLLALLIVGGIILVFWLVYAFIASVMEFVFIESLRTSEVHVRRYFSANLGRGVRLLLFRLGIILLGGVLGLGPAAFVALQGSFGDLSGGLIALYALYAFGLFFVFSIVTRFTSEFVAPIMLLEDRGVIGAWSRFWSTFTANWSEYVVYLLLAWILSLAIAIAAWLVMMFGILILLIPFAIVIFLLVLLGDIGVILAVPVGLLALLAILLFVSLVWTPITTFFRYYALLLLGDTNDELDLIPDQRAAVRSDGGPTTADEGWNGAERGERRPSDRDDDWTSDRDDSPDDTSGPWDDERDRDDSDPWDDSSDSDDRSW